MATTDRRADGQTSLGRYGRYEYERGEFIEVSSGKIQLSECPLCARDPERPRHEFDDQHKRAVHFYTQHTVDEL